MATYGPSFSSAGANDNAFGNVAWSNPGNITANDNTNAQAASIAAAAFSQYLKATCPNLSVPVGATVNSITVRVAKSRSGASNLEDERVRLEYSGSIQATDKSIVGNWAGTETVSTYVWNSSLPTVAELNGGNVKLAFACQNIGATNPASANVDYIEWEVDATPAAAGTTKSQVVMS